MSGATSDERQIDPVGWLAWLTRSVAQLAADASTQIDYITELGSGPSADELALEFADAYIPLQQHFPQLALPQAAVDRLRELDTYLSEISGEQNGHLWTVDALRNSAEWVRVRQLARAALEGLPRTP